MFFLRMQKSKTKKHVYLQKSKTKKHAYLQKYKTKKNFFILVAIFPIFQRLTGKRYNMQFSMLFFVIIL